MEPVTVPPPMRTGRSLLSFPLSFCCLWADVACTFHLASPSVRRVRRWQAETGLEKDSLTLSGLTALLDDAIVDFEKSLTGEEEEEARELMLVGRDLTKETLLCTRFDLHLRRVCLQPDAFGGWGVFAVRDLREGELITCMPADLSIHNDSGDELWGSHVDDFAESYEELAAYQISEGDDYTLVGLPSMRGDPAYLGHFANDAAMLASPAEDPLAGVDVYERDTTSGANAEHTSLYLHMATVATRDIAAGEEVLVTYGIDYWVEHAERQRRRKNGSSSATCGGDRG